MTHEELMDWLIGVMNVMYWAIVVLASIIVIGIFSGYVVEALAQERIISSQCTMGCSK
jgi:uncharacterized membrane protein